MQIFYGPSQRGQNFMYPPHLRNPLHPRQNFDQQNFFEPRQNFMKQPHPHQPHYPRAHATHVTHANHDSWETNDKFKLKILCFKPLVAKVWNPSKRLMHTWTCNNTYYILLYFHDAYYNHGHNILRLFDNLPNFLFTISETKRGY